MPPFFQFSALRRVRHAITTRHGGVSAEPYATLNMGLSTDDPPENLVANRRIVFASLGIREETVLFARLSHGREVSVFRRDRPEEWPVTRLPRKGGGVDAAFMSDAAITDASGLNFSL